MSNALKKTIAPQVQTFGPQIERVGPPDPAQPTSPILRAKSNPAEGYCFYNGKRYSTGELLGIEGQVFQCFYGTWVDKGKTCGDE
jgi:hypothetical protein